MGIVHRDLKVKIIIKFISLKTYFMGQEILKPLSKFQTLASLDLSKESSLQLLVEHQAMLLQKSLKAKVTAKKLIIGVLVSSYIYCKW